MWQRNSTKLSWIWNHNNDGHLADIYYQRAQKVGEITAFNLGGFPANDLGSYLKNDFTWLAEQGRMLLLVFWSLWDIKSCHSLKIRPVHVILDANLPVLCSAITIVVTLQEAAYSAAWSLFSVLLLVLTDFSTALDLKATIAAQEVIGDAVHF